jgi:hypothetical protein
MLTKSQLILTSVVLLAVLVVMNLAMVYLTRNSVPRRVMRHARESQSAGVLALGNSLVAAGFDESAFDIGARLSPPRGAANLGLGASTPVEQILLFRYALSHGMRPRILIYGFYDFQLTVPIQLTTSELIGNHAMLYYVEPFYARRFYSLSLHDSFQFRAMHAIPMLADRGAIWAKVEILRRAFAQLGMPAERTNRFGRASDFSLLESDNSEDFRRQCEASLDLQIAPPVNELLRQAHDAGITIAVVEMPMRGAHRNLFYDTACWPQYVAHVRDLLAPYNVIWVDASTWIQDDSRFADPLHLSALGAAQFSNRLGSLLGTHYPNLSAQSDVASGPGGTPVLDHPLHRAAWSQGRAH